MRTAVFLERDGILNLPNVEGAYQIAPRTFGELNLNRAAIAPLLELKAAGFMLIVTTNQPGVSRGTITRRDMDLMHRLIERTFSIDDIFTCLHDDADGCPCRKPRPGLFREAAYKWQLDLDHSFVISDKWQDAQAAHSIGCTSILLQSPWNGRGHHDFSVQSLERAVAKVLQLQQRNAFSCLTA